jgi:outer membrane protein
MKQTSYKIALAALLVSVSLPATTHAATLKEALGQAYAANPSLQAARSQLEATAEELPSAYAGFLPSVSANYEHGRDEQKYGSRTDDNQVRNRQIQATQPIFNGFGSVAEVKRAQNLISAEQHRLTAVEQEVLSDAVTAYMDVVRAQRVLELNLSNVQVLSEQLQATKDRFELGETTRTDVAQSEARLSRAVSDKTVAEGTLVAAKANYQQVIGTEPVNVSMPNSLPGIPGTLTESINLATEHNPNVRFSEYRADAAENDIYIAGSRILPSANVQAVKRKEDGLASFFGSTEREVDSLMFNVNIPLYQSGSEYAQVRQNKRTREQRNNELQDSRNKAVEQVTRAWESVRTSRATIKSTTDAVNAAQIALEGVKQEAELGARTVLDILDAEQELFITRVNLVSAQRNEVIATYTLLAALGELTAESQQLDVERYDQNEYKDKVKYKVIGF